jgi:hypothetical protein
MSLNDEDTTGPAAERREPSAESPDLNLITRREAVRRVSALLGGIALVGGSALITGCRDDGAKSAGDTAKVGKASGEQFSAEEIAFLDEVADTILPTTAKSPGAKAAKTGAFMALMVKDTYEDRDAKVFREGMKKIDDESEKMHKVSFMKATPQQRTALLERLDREQKDYTDRLQAARESGAKGEAAKKEEEGKEADKRLPDQRQENAPTPEAGAGGATAITADAPAHYFRMMKELALLGYFTSEIGYTKAMRYVESPGRYDPCAPYTKGEPAWAPHA